MCHIRVWSTQYDDGIILSTLLLLDTCSTTNVGKNPDMFKDHPECLEECRLNVVNNGEKKAFN